LAAFHVSHGDEVAPTDPLPANAEAAEFPRIEPHELLAGPRGVRPVSGVQVRRQVVPAPARERLRVAGEDRQAAPRHAIKPQVFPLGADGAVRHFDPRVALDARRREGPANVDAAASPDVDGRDERGAV